MLDLNETKVKTSNEKWSHYTLLDDNTTLKIKTVLISVFDEGFDPQGNPAYILQSVNVLGAIPPKELIGNDPLNEIKDMKFEIIDNPWNEYTLENDLVLMIRPTLTQVTRTGVRDIRGLPLYSIQAQATIKFQI